jgi:predicted GIY-YIG superfamily endonuclease
MDFFVYILKCKDQSYYVGHTDNIETRLAEHDSGISHHTSKRLPVKLLYMERFATRDEAFIVERKIKGWSRRKKEAFMQQDFDLLVYLSNYKK